MATVSSPFFLHKNSRFTKNVFMDIFSKDVKVFTANLKKVLTSNDVKFHDFKIGNKVDATLVYVDSLTDKFSFAESVIKPLIALKGDIDYTSVKNAILSPEIKEICDKKSLFGEILGGNGIVIIDQSTTALSVGFKRFEKRAVIEPPTSVTLKGPREGFVEDLNTNLSLIRRRLKNSAFTVELFEVGRYSKTQVALCYVKGVAIKGLKEKIAKKLKEIDVDYITDSSSIAKLISPSTTSLFKQVGTTEKPDVLVAKIMEGRVCILVDGSPFVLTLPYLIIEDFQSADDYYSDAFKATLLRFLRLFSVLCAVLLPAFFVSAQLYHLQLLPLSFLLTIVNSVKGIPLSPSFEMFLTLMIFEILNEASIRMPKYVGMAVSIVGGLVLGETAVNAGIISAPTLMIVAMSGICLYTVPEMAQTFSILRLLFLLTAGSTGAYGIIVLFVLLLVFLTSFEPFGTPTLAPFAPLIKSDLKDGFYKGFYNELIYRPKSLNSPNKIRQKVNKRGTTVS